MTALPLALDASLKSVGLPVAVRKEINLLVKLLKEVQAAPHGQKGLAYEHGARQMTAAGYEMTTEGFRKLMPLYEEEGWEGLIDGRKVSHADNKLPVAFVQEVKRRFDLQPRSRKDAWQTLISEWKKGKPITGYRISPPADAFTRIPVGWSYKHLCRVCKSSAFERVAMTIGLGKARAKHGSKLFQSRIGCYPFSHVMIDDVYHDNFVHVLTKKHRQLCRVAELGCLDVLSGSRFMYGSLPLLKKKDGTTDSIKESYTRLLVAKYLYEYGFSPRGTIILGEHKTATLRDNIVALLSDRTEGLVTFDAGGWTGKQQAVAGMFRGDGGGNPRHKSLLESFHNLMHNRFAALPGQTGPDVERRPEFLDGMLKESDQLLRVASQLSPWQVERLKFPTLEYFTEFLSLAQEIYRHIDFDPDHNLEGWEKLGYMTRRFRLHRDDDKWIDEQKFLTDYSPAAQGAIREIVKGDPACQDVRRLSRGEVFAMGRKQVIPASVALIAEMLYEDIAKPRSCRNSYFEFQDEELDPEPLRYESRVRKLDGREMELADDTYDVVANPFDLRELWVYTGRGEYLGLARRVEPVSRTDREGVQRELARVGERTNALRAPLLQRHAQLAREETRRQQNNNDVIDGPRSPEEARAEQTRLAEPLSADDAAALSTPVEITPTPTPAASELSTQDFL